MTARTITDLVTNLFQDGQPAGSITAADMRDLIESLRIAHGGFSMATPAATTITVAGTYYKAAGTTTFDSVSHEADDASSTSNRIRYTGAPDRHGTMTASISFTCASNNQILGFKLARNGTVIDNSVTRQKIGTGADVASIVLVAHADVSTNDYLELFVTNETSTATVTVQNCHVVFHGHAD